VCIGLFQVYTGLFGVYIQHSLFPSNLSNLSNLSVCRAVYVAKGLIECSPTYSNLSVCRALLRICSAFLSVHKAVVGVHSTYLHTRVI